MAGKIICILTIILIWIVFLWLKERSLRKRIERQEKETDRELTRYIAENIDITQNLLEVRKECKEQQGMADEIKKMQLQSRSLKHDMKNHSLVILSYLDEGKVEEAKYYTSHILDTLNKTYTYIHVGNSLMNYIINNKLSRAKELGIEIKAEIENLAFSYMESVDFSSLLNNLLDNAIEAACKSKEKKLEVRISNQKGLDSVMVKNSIDDSVLLHNPNFISTKTGEGHGFGMKQIQKITEKYDGMTDIYEENNYFVINVVYHA